MIYRDYLKRVLEILPAIVVFIILLPLFISITIFLSIVNKGTPFFIQERPGYRERIFNIVKFKTMNDKKNPSGELLPDSERLTKIGGFIRKTSLDEIPQLINVLKGDMSFVGPRPLLPEYLALYNENQKKRHNVRPGITGWAQINGRNAISWKEKLELDIWYVENISFFLDLKIIFKTIKKVVISEGVNADGQATTEAFNGNN